MRFLLFEHIRTANESLRRTRSRTLLTISGIAIGVASITAILALSRGITDMIENQVTQAGSTIAIVRPHAATPSLSDLSSPTPKNAYSLSPLTQADSESIAKVPGVTAVAPLMTIDAHVRNGNEVPKKSVVLATTPGFTQTTTLTMDEGQFLDEKTLENTAVVGHQLSVDLFGTDQANGKQFTIKNQTFTVIGVLKRQNNPINYNNVDFDSAAIISLDSGKLFNSGVAQIQQINVRAKDGASMPAVQKAISDTLAKNHDTHDDTSVLIGDQVAVPTSKLFMLINVLLTWIAGISLLVGGVGIMNIMLVSVAERTREIGLRKAVGASNSMVITQFMIEALIMSLGGGLLGFVGGYVIAFAVSLLLPYDPSFSWTIVAWALGLSIGVGVLFGVYPAIKASRKDPIESLRHYH